MKYLFSCNAVKWFDKVNGNTYHSVRVTRLADGAIITHEWTYGYGDSYRQTALEIMLKAGWLKDIKTYPNGASARATLKSYTEENLYMFERENEYPILWNVHEKARKREMVENGRFTKQGN